MKVKDLYNKKIKVKKIIFGCRITQRHGSPEKAIDFIKEFLKENGMEYKVIDGTIALPNDGYTLVPRGEKIIEGVLDINKSSYKFYYDIDGVEKESVGDIPKKKNLNEKGFDVFDYRNVKFCRYEFIS